jgi:GcrA cell cycle regulator
MSKGWDNATLKKLKSLTGKGLSTAEIGKRLGMSKNAIVGKLNRLGWNPKAAGAPAPKTAVKKTAKAPVKKVAAKPAPKAKPTAKAPVKKEVAKPVAKPVAAKAKPAPKAAPAPKSSPKNLAMHQRIIQHSLSMASLKPNQCRWPIGDPDSENFHFCGAPVFVGKPYCYEHCKQAYQFNPPKKK